MYSPLLPPWKHPRRRRLTDLYTVSLWKEANQDTVDEATAHQQYLSMVTDKRDCGGAVARGSVHCPSRGISSLRARDIQESRYSGNVGGLFLRNAITEEICHYSSECGARLTEHPNDVAVNLIEQPDNRKVRRHVLKNLPTRFTA
jgi:hypothetical protein